MLCVLLPFSRGILRLTMEGHLTQSRSICSTWTSTIGLHRPQIALEICLLT